MRPVRASLAPIKVSTQVILDRYLAHLTVYLGKVPSGHDALPILFVLSPRATKNELFDQFFSSFELSS